MRRTTRWLWWALLPWLSGCQNLTGLIDAGDEFGCGVAPGVRCATLSDNFERGRALKTEENAVRVAPPASATKEVPSVKPDAAAHGENPPRVKPRREPRPVKTTDPRLVREARRFETGDPARDGEVVMMLWVMPWVDEAGDYHAASRVWLKTREARWRIERERSRAAADAPMPGEE